MALNDLWRRYAGRRMPVLRGALLGISEGVSAWVDHSMPADGQAARGWTGDVQECCSRVILSP